MIKELGQVIYQPTKVEEGIYASPASFRLDMRIFLKEMLPEIYFKKSDKYAPAKNLGCFLFGQKDTWRGVVNIRIEEVEKNNKAKITILLDSFRIDSSIRNEIIDTINNLLKEMEKKTDFVKIISDSPKEELIIKEGFKNHLKK